LSKKERAALIEQLRTPQGRDGEKKKGKDSSSASYSDSSSGPKDLGSLSI
jgi:hypothetical protein